MHLEVGPGFPSLAVVLFCEGLGEAVEVHEVPRFISTPVPRLLGVSEARPEAQLVGWYVCILLCCYSVLFSYRSASLFLARCIMPDSLFLTHHPRL